MISLYLACLLTGVLSLEVHNHELFFKKNEEACKKFGVDSYFDPEVVIGPPWRVYYTWNVDMDDKCLALTFRNVTPWIINRFWTDMGEYIEEQPAWEAAMLYVTMGPAHHQMLLFADQGPAGRVHGVPNVMRDSNFVKKNRVPLMRFQLKLLREGTYLAMMDCLGGQVLLCARAAPYRAEVESVAAGLGGGGLPACARVANPHEQTGDV